MALESVSLTDTNDRPAKSVKQDQTAHTCRVILLYTLYKINPLVSNARITAKGEKRPFIHSLFYPGLIHPKLDISTESY